MTTLKITGMTCGHCVMSAKKALAAVPGVRSAQVDLASGLAQVEGEAPLEALVAAVEGEGYSAVEA
jgi:copper chaperone CopZ